METYITVAELDGKTYGMMIVSDGGSYFANIAELNANGEPVRTLIDEDGFEATYGAQATQRDCILVAMQEIF